MHVDWLLRSLSGQTGGGCVCGPFGRPFWNTSGASSTYTCYAVCTAYMCIYMLAVVIAPYACYIYIYIYMRSAPYTCWRSLPPHADPQSGHSNIDRKRIYIYMIHIRYMYMYIYDIYIRYMYIGISAGIHISDGPFHGRPRNMGRSLAIHGAHKDMRPIRPVDPVVTMWV